jgi:hypothetical protein
MATLEQGRTITLINADEAGAGSLTFECSIESDAMLASLWVESCSGDLDIIINTVDTDGHLYPSLVFPTINSQTTTLLIRKAALVMGRIRVNATFTGAVKFRLVGKGIGSGETSVKLIGSATASSSSINVPTTPTLLFPVSLDDRDGLVIKNYDLLNTLFIGFTVGEVTAPEGYPLGPGSSIAITLQGGQGVYGRASAGTIDVRKMESGG